MKLQSIEVDPENGMLSVQGSGFPPARSCVLSAEGKLFVAGRPSQEVSRELRCRSVSEHAVAASLGTWNAELPGSALFEGELRVGFADDQGELQLRASLPGARVRLRGTGSNDPKMALAEAHEARAFQRALGIAEVEVHNRGLVLTALAVDGPAARAGLEIGDVVTRIDGAPVELVSDLRGRPGARSLQLHYARAGAPLRTVDIALAVKEPEGPRLAGQLMFALGAILALLLPGRRRASSERPRVASFAGAAGLLIASILVLRALDVRLLWLLPCGVHLSSLAYGWYRRTLSLPSMSLELVELGISSLAVSALGIAGGSLELPFAHTAGSDLAALSPWTFALFATPSGWLAGLVLLRRTCRQAEAPRSPSWLQPAARLATLVAFASAPVDLVGVLAMLILLALLLSVDVPELPRWAHVGLAFAALLVAMAGPALLSAHASATWGAALCGLLLTGALRNHLNRRKPAPSTLDPQLLPFV